MKDNNTVHIKVSRESIPSGNTDWERVDALSDEEVEQAALSDPDAQPTSPEAMTRFRRATDVKKIRERLSLSQEEFASIFHLPLATVRGWEQARQQPDPVAQVLLTLIARSPDVVRETLAGA